MCRNMVVAKVIWLEWYFEELIGWFLSNLPVGLIRVNHGKNTKNPDETVTVNQQEVSSILRFCNFISE